MDNREISILQEQFTQLNEKFERLISSKQIEQPIDIQAASEFLGLPISTIYKIHSEGKIPSYKVGKHLRFYKSQLSSWVKSQRPKFFQLN
jgi:excisionase family DNA binding protein